MGIRQKGLFFLDLAAAALGTFFDQYTKHLAVMRLKGQDPFPLIDGVLEFRYLENRGAAFGMLQNQRGLFVVMTTLLLAVTLFLLWNMPTQGRYRPLHLMGAVLIAGAMGNFLDRLRLDYVVDFIYFRLIDFPIFNLADIYVSLLCAVGICVILFGPYREEDFAFLKPAVEKLMFWRR